MNANAATLPYQSAYGISDNVSEATTSVYSANPIDLDLFRCERQLKVLAEDKRQWAEGAAPPSPIAIAFAATILMQFRSCRIVPTTVVCSAEGGIAICFDHGKKYADIECLNTGTLLGVLSNRRDRPIAWEIRPGAADVAQSCAWIAQYLNPHSAKADAAGWETTRQWIQRHSSPVLSLPGQGYKQWTFAWSGDQI